MAGAAMAYQDVYININDRAFGMCLSVDTMDNPVCANNTLSLEGTSDHILYILPETNIQVNDSLTTKFTYVLFTPLNVIIGGLGLMVFAFLFAIAVMAWLLRVNNIKIFD